VREQDVLFWIAMSISLMIRFLIDSDKTRGLIMRRINSMMMKKTKTLRSANRFFSGVSNF
jgi:hypothetical protein